MVLSSTSYTERLTGAQKEYTALANEHLKHDLKDTDRALLERAARKVGIHSTVGASVGLGVGLLLSLRIRRAGQAIYNAARTVEKPTAIQFADGHTVPFPDTSEAFRPSKAGQAVMGVLFSISGFFLGGELGLLTGSASASRAIAADPPARGRIESAFRSFRIDVLRSQADQLERGGRLGTAGPAGTAEAKLV